jgi:hypothetical protein
MFWQGRRGELRCVRVRCDLGLAGEVSCVKLSYGILGFVVARQARLGEFRWVATTKPNIP